EDWHYTSVAPIAESTFTLPTATDPATTLATLTPHLVDDAWNRLVFVNGHFARDLSSFTEMPEDVDVSTIDQALITDPAFLESRLAALVSDASAFAALNTAFLRDGVVVRVPADCRVEQPLHIVWVADARATGAALFPRL